VLRRWAHAGKHGGDRARHLIERGVAGVPEVRCWRRAGPQTRPVQITDLEAACHDAPPQIPEPTTGREREVIEERARACHREARTTLAGPGATTLKRPRKHARVGARARASATVGGGWPGGSALHRSGVTRASTSGPSGNARRERASRQRWKVDATARWTAGRRTRRGRSRAPSRHHTPTWARHAPWSSSGSRGPRKKCPLIG
jgi:hypothetical protein